MCVVNDRIIRIELVYEREIVMSSVNTRLKYEQEKYLDANFGKS